MLQPNQRICAELLLWQVGDVRSVRLRWPAGCAGSRAPRKRALIDEAAHTSGSISQIALHYALALQLDGRISPQPLAQGTVRSDNLPVTTWDDKQYLEFADERTRPARELLARVPLDYADHVVDLGCGPGNSTALLHQRWPAARVVGVDNSKEMLLRARADFPQLAWIDADAATFTPEAPLDLLFANALLQWLPNHESLVPRLLALLRPGGVLAVQMPHNFLEPSHRLMRELGGTWTARLTGIRPHPPVAPAAFYYDLLAPRTRYVDVWQTTYEHIMVGPERIVDWVKATGLRPFLDALPEEERAAYLEAYTLAIDSAYPPRADGRRLFSFPRLFIVAVC